MKNKFLPEDSIVAEVHKARANIIRKFGSARAYVKYLHAHPKQGINYVTMPPKRPIESRHAA